jgi:hypothetical protein
MDKQYSFVRKLHWRTPQRISNALPFRTAAAFAKLTSASCSVAVIARDQIIKISLNYNTQITHLGRIFFQETNILSTGQEITTFKETKGSFPCSQKPTIRPYLQPNEVSTPLQPTFLISI